VNGFLIDANVLLDIRRHCGKFESVEQMHRLTGLPVSVMRRLAEADAFGSLGLSRREALWHVMALTDEELPLFELDDADSSFILHPSSFLRKGIRP